MSGLRPPRDGVTGCRAVAVSLVAVLLLCAAPASAVGVDTVLSVDLRDGTTSAGLVDVGPQDDLLDLDEEDEDDEGDEDDGDEDDDEDDEEEGEDDDDEEEHEGDDGDGADEDDGEEENDGEGEGNDEDDDAADDDSAREGSSVASWLGGLDGEDGPPPDRPGDGAPPGREEDPDRGGPPDDREDDRDGSTGEPDGPDSADGEDQSESSDSGEPTDTGAPEASPRSNDEGSDETTSSGASTSGSDDPPDGDEAEPAGGDRSTEDAGSGSTPQSGVATPTAQSGIWVQDVSTNRSAVSEGEPVEITAVLVNAGDRTDARRVQLRLFGEVVAVRTVTVPTDRQRRVSFVRRIEAPGTYEATIGNVSTTVDVTAEDQSTSAANPVSQEAPGFTTGAALVGVLVATLVARRRS